jgi:hypothetical protein
VPVTICEENNIFSRLFTALGGGTVPGSDESGGMGGLSIRGTVSISSFSLQGLRQQATTERMLLQRDREAEVDLLLADRACCGCGCCRWAELELELDVVWACAALSISVILKHTSVARTRRSISNVKSKSGLNLEDEEEDMTPMPSMK